MKIIDIDVYISSIYRV